MFILLQDADRELRGGAVVDEDSRRERHERQAGALERGFLGCDAGAEGADGRGDFRDRPVLVGGVGGGVQEPGEGEALAVEVRRDEGADAWDVPFEGVVGVAGGKERKSRGWQ